MTNKGRLFQLNEDCKKHNKPKAKEISQSKKVKGSFFDKNNALSLSYELDIQPETLQQSYSRVFNGDSFAFTNQETGGDFFFESFSDEPEIVKESHNNYKEEHQKPAPKFFLEENETMSEPEGDQLTNKTSDESKPPETDEEESTEKNDVILKKQSSGSDKNDKKTDTLSDEEFTKDLAAILRGEKKYDADSKTTVPFKKEEKQQSQTEKEFNGQNNSVTKKPTKPSIADNEHVKDEHAIFDKISQSMRYANSYDLGSLALEQRFDEMDKEIENKDVKNILNVSGVEQEQEQEEEPAIQKQSKLAEDDIVDADKSPVTEKDPEKENQLVQSESFSGKEPLDFTNGGWSTDPSFMEPGDIILSTTNDPDISGRIRKISNSAFSHAGVYIGNEQVIEAIEDPGVVVRSLETAMRDDTITIVLRHKDLTPEKANKVIEFLKSKKNPESRAGFDRWAVIRNIPVQMLTSHCDKLAPELRNVCRNFSGNIFLGTEDNNEFYCSELVFEAYKQAGLPLSDTQPHWTSAEDLVRLTYNGTLQYAGHLKLET